MAVEPRDRASGAVLLSARGVSKSFAGLHVIKNVDFDVGVGEVLGVLGPNGAGKTTLFNLISGDLGLSSGQIALAGRPLSKLPAHRRAALGIGRTYQIPRPYGAMTAFENLLVSAMFSAGKSERDSYRTCLAVLEDCGLSSRANRPAGALTLLDRKRLELARALAGEPKLLLLDEIAGGLTDEEAADLVSLIRKIQHSGVTIIWIEHVVHALMAVADRMMVLDFGSKIADGKPGDVMADPEVRRAYMGIEA
ncbi:ABC transporter ATP-binding protein [Bradyrhizobium manausense]|uniref:ABC transporter ATP-binding protein n=1 Tax=Bradyrhizobium manausense TaxID=989370 RepID=A0A0R3E5T2_9BRAD|nr:ABC transporter ATP-binding protein [Bradyrhizobium manausense]KRQ15838.1 ABC transporter ATP-binding protein [Bradyrhizobium manausense]